MEVEFVEEDTNINCRTSVEFYLFKEEIYLGISN